MIRNDLLGGLDWIRGDNLKPIDLNDTFDEVERVSNSWR